jgi:hypothetical protein
MTYIGIDPGPTQSAYCVIETSPIPAEIVIIDKGKIDNGDLLLKCSNWQFEIRFGDTKIGIEMIASYGMPVGAEVFETCKWIGRFIERLETPYHSPKMIYRKDEKITLCGTMKAKDANIRQALIDRYGKPGTKKEPGILYGFKADEWAALAVAVTLMEKENLREAV